MTWLFPAPAGHKRCQGFVVIPAITHQTASQLNFYFPEDHKLKKRSVALYGKTIPLLLHVHLLSTEYAKIILGCKVNKMLETQTPSLQNTETLQQFFKRFFKHAHTQKLLYHSAWQWSTNITKSECR